MAKDRFLRGVGGELQPITSADNVAPFTNAADAVALGDAVYLSGAGSVAKASATTTAQPAIGFVYEITDSTHCLVIFGGVFENFTTGMTPGDSYYLAEAAGTVQTTPVLGATKLAQYLGKALSTTDLLVEPTEMSRIGTSAGQIIALNYQGYLPALDGRNLTNLPASSDPELDAIAGLTSAADQVPYFTGSGTASLFTATQGGRAMAGLSWSSGTQVPSLTAAGTAGMLTVGTGNNNLVQLDGSAKLPAVDGSNLTNLPGGATTALTKTFSQASNGFAVGDALRHNGTDWVKAQADSAANAEVFAVVSGTGDPVFTVTFSGYISGLSGLTAGAGHFLSPSSAGALTATDPTTSGQVSKPVLVAITTTTAVVQILRGYVIP